MYVTRFEEIMDEILSLAHEAMDLVEENEPHEVAAAKAYWYPQLLGTVDGENSGYLGGSMHDMRTTLKAFEDIEEAV